MISGVHVPKRNGNNTMYQCRVMIGYTMHHTTAIMPELDTMVSTVNIQPLIMLIAIVSLCNT
jgi:hypothetical protein